MILFQMDGRFRGSQVKLQKSVATNSEVIKTLAPGEAVQATVVEDGIDGLWMKDEVFHGVSM